MKKVGNFLQLVAYLFYVLNHTNYEPKAGLEPATYALRMRCSTN